jgi:hypothetical protein
VTQIATHLRRCFAVLSAAAILADPALPAPNSSSPLGTITFAERAHVGASAASLGSTLFGGDRLSTEVLGTLQIRTSGARLHLSATSSAILLQEQQSPAAILTRGTVTFSTASRDAFRLHAFSATIKANSNQPTVGQVAILGNNEFLVKSTRGSLVCSVDGEEKVIAEGDGFRVLLDAPEAADQGPAGSGGNRYPPRKAGRSKAVFFLIAAVAIPTIILVHEALESPDRP